LLAVAVVVTPLQTQVCVALAVLVVAVMVQEHQKQIKLLAQLTQDQAVVLALGILEMVLLAVAV
jgi:hypothetical protein